MSNSKENYRACPCGLTLADPSPAPHAGLRAFHSINFLQTVVIYCILLFLSLLLSIRMAWGQSGAGKGVEDWVPRLLDNDPKLTSITVFRTRRLDHEVRRNTDALSGKSTF